MKPYMDIQCSTYRLLRRLYDNAIRQHRCGCPATPRRFSAASTPKICSIDDVERVRPWQRRLQAVLLHVTAPAQNGSSETGVPLKGLAEERAMATRVVPAG